jgi:hypothetical protein
VERSRLGLAHSQHRVAPLSWLLTQLQENRLELDALDEWHMDDHLSPNIGEPLAERIRISPHLIVNARICILGSVLPLVPRLDERLCRLGLAQVQAVNASRLTSSDALARHPGALSLVAVDGRKQVVGLSALEEGSC